MVKREVGIGILILVFIIAVPLAFSIFVFDPAAYFSCEEQQFLSLGKTRLPPMNIADARTEECYASMTILNEDKKIVCVNSQKSSGSTVGVPCPELKAYKGQTLSITYFLESNVYENEGETVITVIY